MSQALGLAGVCPIGGAASAEASNGLAHAEPSFARDTEGVHDMPPNAKHVAM